MGDNTNEATLTCEDMHAQLADNSAEQNGDPVVVSIL